MAQAPVCVSDVRFAPSSFTGKERDTESGNDYFVVRYYDSRTGTFCSADPLAGSPDDPQSWNRYAYGRNDPIDVTDPSGKSWWSSLLIGVGVGIGLAILPELAPEWFGATATGTGSVTFSSTIQLGGWPTLWSVTEAGFPILRFFLAKGGRPQTSARLSCLRTILSR